MHAEKFQIDQAAALDVGGTFKSDSLHYTVHRYKSGWMALWNDPVSGNLGRELATTSELRRFMGGDFQCGRVIGRGDWAQ